MDGDGVLRQVLGLGFGAGFWGMFGGGAILRIEGLVL